MRTSYAVTDEDFYLPTGNLVWEWLLSEGWPVDQLVRSVRVVDEGTVRVGVLQLEATRQAGEVVTTEADFPVRTLPPFAR